MLAPVIKLPKENLISKETDNIKYFSSPEQDTIFGFNSIHVKYNLRKDKITTNQVLQVLSSEAVTSKIYGTMCLLELPSNVNVHHQVKWPLLQHIFLGVTFPRYQVSPSFSRN